MLICFYLNSADPLVKQNTEAFCFSVNNNILPHRGSF